MTGFAFVCPHARPDENGAHDITDAMSRTNVDDDQDDRVLFCRRCGQAIPLPVVVAASRQDPDLPEEAA